MTDEEVGNLWRRVKDAKPVAVRDLIRKLVDDRIHFYRETEGWSADYALNAALCDYHIANSSGHPRRQGAPMTDKDPLKPNLTLLCKLGSIAVHVEEMLSAKGHIFDRSALESLLSDDEVREWIKAMGVYLPRKR